MLYMHFKIEIDPHDDSPLLHPIPLCKIIDLSTFQKSRQTEYSNLMIEVIIQYVFISNFPLPGQPKYIERQIILRPAKKCIISRGVCYDRQIKSIFAMKYYPDMYRIPNSQFAITTILSLSTNTYNAKNGFDMFYSFMGPWQISICKYKN